MESNFKIIVIDDNPAIHQDFIKILKTDASSDLDKLSIEMFGENNKKEELPCFEIDSAHQGEEGVKKIEEALKKRQPYSLAFVDIRMPPGWNGIETIKHIWAIDKNIQVVICTAYSDYTWEETVKELGKTDNLLILKKPFDNVSVRQLACALTRKWQLAGESRNYTNKLKEEVAYQTSSLEKSLSLIKSTFESSSEGILVVNNEGKVTDYNQKFVDMLEIPKSVLEAKNEKAILEHMKNQLAQSNEYFMQKQDFRSNFLDAISIDVIKLKNGTILECYSQPHKLNGQIIGRILDFRDITTRAKLEENLEYQATHDILTDLPNRVKLLERLDVAIKTSLLNSSQFAVLFLDLDRFKLINDSLSHEVGDELLRTTAKRLLSAMRREDTLARLGGDEFVIIFMNIHEKTIIEKKVRDLLGLFQKPFDIANRAVTITSSIGISLYPKDGKTIGELLRNADAAMYRAKAHKSNNFQFYTPEMNKLSLEELDKEMELRQAIINKEFILYYQPQVHLTNKKIVAVEALIRWKHPKKGILLPIDFILLAEETGLIIPIGEWVLQTACAQNKAWQDAGFPPMRIAVNISSQQIMQSDIIKTISTVLKETGLKPEYLELELTENVLLSNKEIIRVITELKKLGVAIAIDDFGTGYSSLSYLHKIPLDRLKIDASFVQHIQSATDDEVIIRAIIAMAHSLHLEVLAEGVETENQLSFLKNEACADVQGFYLSKALTSQELETVLKNPQKITLIEKEK